MKTVIHSTDYPNVTLKAVRDYYESAGKVHTKEDGHEESNTK